MFNLGLHFQIKLVYIASVQVVSVQITSVQMASLNNSLYQIPSTLKDRNGFGSNGLQQKSHGSNGHLYSLGSSNLGPYFK